MLSFFFFLQNTRQDGDGQSSNGNKPRFLSVTTLEDVQAIRCAEFHPQGSLYAVGSNSKTLRICAYPKLHDLRWVNRSNFNISRNGESETDLKTSSFIGPFVSQLPASELLLFFETCSFCATGSTESSGETRPTSCYCLCLFLCCSTLWAKTVRFLKKRSPTNGSHKWETIWEYYMGVNGVRWT